MKKLLVGLMTFATVLTSQASMLEMLGPLDQTFFDAEVHEDKSYFEVLGDMYKSATTPSLSKLANTAWAGRCFSLEDKNVPTNGGYVFRSVKADAGPIAKTKYQGVTYDLGGFKPANFFDDKTYSQILSAEFWNGLGLGFKLSQTDIEESFFDVSVMDGAVVGKYKFGTGFSTSLKLSEKYLVEEISKSSEDVGPIGQTKIVVRCYYFLPEYNN